MKKLLWILFGSLLALSLTACGSVGPDDCMGWELQDLSAGTVTEATWWRMEGADRIEGPLTEQQLQELVEGLNEMGDKGVSYGTRGCSDSVGICLKEGGRTWEIRLTGLRNQVEVDLSEPEYSVVERNKTVAKLLQQIEDA